MKEKAPLPEETVLEKLFHDGVASEVVHCTWYLFVLTPDHRIVTPLAPMLMLGVLGGRGAEAVATPSPCRIRKK